MIKPNPFLTSGTLGDKIQTRTTTTSPSSYFNTSSVYKPGMPSSLSSNLCVPSYPSSTNNNQTANTNPYSRLSATSMTSYPSYSNTNYAPPLSNKNMGHTTQQLNDNMQHLSAAKDDNKMFETFGTSCPPNQQQESFKGYSQQKIQLSPLNTQLYGYNRGPSNNTFTATRNTLLQSNLPVANNKQFRMTQPKNQNTSLSKIKSSALETGDSQLTDNPSNSNYQVSRQELPKSYYLKTNQADSNNATLPQPLGRNPFVSGINPFSKATQSSETEKAKRSQSAFSSFSKSAKSTQQNYADSCNYNIYQAPSIKYAEASKNNDFRSTDIPLVEDSMLDIKVLEKGLSLCLQDEHNRQELCRLLGLDTDQPCSQDRFQKPQPSYHINDSFAQKPMTQNIQKSHAQPTESQYSLKQSLAQQMQQRLRPIATKQYSDISSQCKNPEPIKNLPKKAVPTSETPQIQSSQARKLGSFLSNNPPQPFLQDSPVSRIAPFNTTVALINNNQFIPIDRHFEEEEEEDFLDFQELKVEEEQLFTTTSFSGSAVSYHSLKNNNNNRYYQFDKTVEADTFSMNDDQQQKEGPLTLQLRGKLEKMMSRKSENGNGVRLFLIAQEQIKAKRCVLVS